MTFEGRIYPPEKGERYWEVKIPDLGVFTQGKSEKDAYAMAVDAVETVVDQKGFRVEIRPFGDGRFLLLAKHPAPLIGRWLQRLRTEKGLTVRQAARRMGSVSPEAWSRYESGRASPTIDKLTQLLRAVAPEAQFTWKRLRLA
ncbi:MAG TPA: helix-turn-helix transcriptional regulator [Bdellovibrionota bacterium]|nr:helix-turn-helix transcriptional regulator [Bdellovibrionota bacterium]